MKIISSENITQTLFEVVGELERYNIQWQCVAMLLTNQTIGVINKNALF